jgi:hypothetical protein
MRRNTFLTAPIKGVEVKRSPVNQISQKRRKLMRERRAMLDETFGPKEEWQCSIPPMGITYWGECYGEVNGHELRKRSAGGSITDPENVVLLCNHHNQMVENRPIEARALGLVVR